MEAAVSLVQSLTKTGRALDPVETLRATKLVTWVEHKLLQKVRQSLRRNAGCPVLCVYSADGWSTKVTTKVTEIGPHIRVDHTGVTRYEFALERALVRVCRPCGKDELHVLLQRPRGMCAGKRTGNFFTAAIEFAPTLHDLGATGLRIQMFVMDGLMYNSFMRLMRPRFASRLQSDDLFDSEYDRMEHECLEWVVGAKCISHGCSNAVVWGLKRYVTQQLRDDAHIGIKALRNTSNDLRRCIHQFVCTRLAPREDVQDDAEAWWTWCNVRQNLLPLFIEADPRWDGQNLLVNSAFFARPDAHATMEVLMLHVLRWSDWSETRWCGVKHAARRLLRSLFCGVAQVVALVQGDRDMGHCHINGFARLTEQVLWYLAMSATCSCPPESVLLMMLKDDRFLKFGSEMRVAMVDSMQRICEQSAGIWQRLHGLVGTARTWHELRSESIRSSVIACGYLEMDAFKCLNEPPFVYTQGDVAANVMNMQGIDVAGVVDEVGFKIAKGLANDIPEEVFVDGLQALRNAAMSSNINERAHGYAARLKEVHQQYGYETLAARACLNSAAPLFGCDGLLRKVAVIEKKIASIDRKTPSRTSLSSMYIQKKANDFKVNHEGSSVPFADMSALVQQASAEWNDMPAAERFAFAPARAEHIRDTMGLLSARRAVLEAQIDVVKSFHNEKRQQLELPNCMSFAEKFTEAELEEMMSTIEARRSVTARHADDFRSPHEPSEDTIDALEELNKELRPLLPQDRGPRPWWEELVAAHRDHFYACAFCDLNTANGENKIFLLLFANQNTSSVVWLECREAHRIVGGGDDDGEAVAWSFRFWEFLDPFVAVPSTKLPFDDMTNLGVFTDTVFRGRRLITPHNPIEFDDFIGGLPPPRCRGGDDNPPKRRRVKHDDVDRMIRENPWCTREDFQPDKKHRKPGKGRKPARGDDGSGSPAGDDDEDSSADDEEHDDDALAVPEHEDEEPLDPGEDLDEVRVSVAELMDGILDAYFTAVPRGGTWTLEHVGVHADSIRGQAVGKVVKEWCDLFGWPKTATFSIVKFGLQGAILFAREWCARSSFFFRLWLEADMDEGFEYPADAGDEYFEDMAYLDFVLEHDVDSPIMARAHDLRILWPGGWAEEDEGSESE